MVNFDLLDRMTNFWDSHNSSKTQWLLLTGENYAEWQGWVDKLDHYAKSKIYSYANLPSKKQVECIGVVYRQFHINIVNIDKYDPIPNF
jgi:hypothetical protein